MTQRLSRSGSPTWAVESEVPRAAPRRRARGAAGFGTEATVLWWPTRSKAARFSTRRQASEGRSGGPAITRGTISPGGLETDRVP